MWMGVGMPVAPAVPRGASGGNVAPSNIDAPSISGTSMQGQTLTASVGSWSGTTPINYAFQWQRSGVDIVGASSADYVIQAADAGSTLRVVVTATNVAGIGSATSSTTSQVPPAPVTAAIYGQSEMEYLLNTGSVYRQITQPTPGDGNLIVFTQNGDGVAPVRTVVNAASVAAGQVNPAMAALSALLAFVRPGRQFVIGDASVPGTSRSSLHNGDEADGRLWADFTSVVSAIEGEFGSVGHLIECWYNSDAQYITNFRNAFWPIYFGTDAAGANFTLGGTNAVTGSVVANCLWDGTALASEKGRGVFARSQTMWHVLTPMPFCDGPVAPTAEATGLSQGLRNSEPARATMHGLASDSLAQSVNLRVGPSAHISDFGGGIHPVTNNADGQILLTWPIAVALMRAAGLTVGEPTIVGIEGPTDGSYADLVVDLPNGGTLTTLRAFRGAAMPATPSPHQQTVTGIEISRAGGARRPVFRTTETSYPVANRGTVTITDTGSGNPRRGRVRIAPETPFAFGDSLSYLRGQANAMLQEPRDVDNKLMLDMMIEHVPGFYDNTALYPFEGIAVRPFQEDVSVLVPAPAFTSRGAFFDGATRYVGNSISVPAGAQGLASFWFRHSGAWATGRTIMEARVGSGAVLSIVTASTGRFSFRLNQDGTGTDLFTPPTNTFVADQWQHILWAWDYAVGRFQMYLNGVALNTAGYSFAGSTKFDMAGANLTQWAVGATTASANRWVGDMGHLWVSVNQTLDLSVQANREKFALGGAPVNLGPNGQLPTGVAPEWYYDGDAPAWANQGTAGNVTLTGALTPSSSVPGG